MSPSALKRRRGTSSSRRNKPGLLVGLVVAMIASSLLLGILLGTHLLLNSSAALNNITQKEQRPFVRGGAVMFQPNQQQQRKQVEEQPDDEDEEEDWQQQQQQGDDIAMDDRDAGNDEEKELEEEGLEEDDEDEEELDDDEQDDDQAEAQDEEKREQQHDKLRHGNDAQQEQQRKEEDEVAKFQNDVQDDFPPDPPVAKNHEDHQEVHEVNQQQDDKKDPYPYNLDELVPDNFDFTVWTAPGGSRFVEYTAGETPYSIDETARKRSDHLARSRRIHVKRAMQFAWKAYEDYAFGHDEVLPQTKSFSDNWGGMGTTLVDSLDTLWLMGMKDEFWKARDWVRDHLNHEHAGSVSVFETTIRSLGGLLSAYDWSGDTAFLDKAQDLGKRLLRAFTTESGIPWGQVSLNNGRTANIGWAGGNAMTAEAGTVQLEFRYLSKMIHDDTYAKKSEHVYEVFKAMDPPNGLYPYFVRNQKKKPSFANNKLTFGAMSDSYYEYMLKIWLQGGRTEPMYREMYDKAIQGMHDLLLQQSTPSGLYYIADKNGASMDHKMDHLVCFMGGLLGLGAYTDPQGLESERAQRDLKTAKALTYTCYQMYARMSTGISAEWIQFHPGQDFGIGRGSPHYLLRPEAVESFFILNQLTGDPIYREWGWEVFCAIERYCKTDVAYGSLSSVEDTNGKPRNKMESFFLAETLKYLYLLQDPDTEVDVLHKHVFNTEAHPMRIFPVIDQEATTK